MKLPFKFLALAFAFAFACGTTMAQSYPNKPVKFVVAFAPGGGTDILARLIGQGLTEQWGQTIIVENKPGADGSIGVDYVAKAAPDGYTILIGTSAEMVFNVGLYSRLPYDPVKDFIPIIPLSHTPMVYAVGSAFPAKSMKELVAMARAKPGGLFYSYGAAHFNVGAELFNREAGTKIVPVPYKGSGPAVNAAVAGEVSIVAASVASVIPQIHAGRLRALAVTSFTRSTFLPDVPTVKESGLDFDVSEGVPSFTGMFAPAGTPAAIIDKLYNEVSTALKSDAVKKRFAAGGYEMAGESRAKFSATLKAEALKWTKVIRDLNLGVN